jgi:hypothetical protein
MDIFSRMMTMSNIYRKPPKEFEINGEKIFISPLKLATLLKVQNLSQHVAEAIAKLRSVIINDYEKITNAKPAGTGAGKEDIDCTVKETHKAAEPSMISLAIRNKTEGIKALFDCLFQNDLLEEILIQSVDKFNSLPKGSLLNVSSETAIDLPTALEIFLAIVDVNAGGFTELGKFSRLLSVFQGAVKGVAPTPAEPVKAS